MTRFYIIFHDKIDWKERQQQRFVIWKFYTDNGIHIKA